MSTAPGLPALKWLERATVVGVAALTPDRVAVGFHEVPQFPAGERYRPIRFDLTLAQKPGVRGAALLAAAILR